MTQQESDELYYTLVFEEGTIQDLEDLKALLLKEGDLIFDCACDGRIKELKSKMDC